MEYLIDGYNVIKGTFLKKTESHSVEYARTYFGNLLAKYRNKHPEVRFTVVYDGHPQGPLAEKYRDIRVIFSGDITADEVIRQLLEKLRDTSHTIVVSNDREVQTGTRILGAKPVGAEEFVDLVCPPPKKPVRKGRDNKEDLNFTEMMAIEKELKSFYGGREEKPRSPKGSR